MRISRVLPMGIVVAVIATGALVAGTVAARSLASRTTSSATGKMATTPGVCLGVELHLRPGSDYLGFRVAPAADMPLDPVVLQTPLYPGAKRSQKAIQPPIIGQPYLGNAIKTRTVEFVAPASVTAVRAWYWKTFTRCGFTSEAELPRTDGQGHKTWARDFNSPSLSQAFVTLTYEGLNSSSTLVQYRALAVTTPPRPASSFAPFGSAVHITYYVPGRILPRGKPSKPTRITVTNQALIQSLDEAIDSSALTNASDDPLPSCPCCGSPSDVLRFMLPHGMSKTFEVSTGCPAGVTTGRVRLGDPSSLMLNTVGYVVYKWLYLHRH